MEELRAKLCTNEALQEKKQVKAMDLEEKAKKTKIFTAQHTLKKKQEDWTSTETRLDELESVLKQERQKVQKEE